MAARIDIEASSDIAQFINRLEKFDKEVSKELKANMRKGAGYVVKEAQARIPSTPLSNWGLSWGEQDRQNGRQLVYNQAQAKRQVKVAAFRARRRGSTIGFGYQAVQKDPAASIFELAGSKNPNGTERSRASGRGSYTFNQNILRAFGSGPYPRIMYPAYYAGITKSRAEIERALEVARRRVGL
jgi:hypothetical protein